MLSPLDLQNKRVVTKKRKYEKEEMDEYLAFVFENYKALYDEHQELQKQVKTLSEGIQYYRSIETTMQKALVLAEKTSKETKDAALLKAEAIEKDANTKAAKIVSDAENEYDKMKEKCLTLMQQFNQYKMQLKQVATAQLELLTSESFDVYLPEMDAIQREATSTITENLTKPEPETPVAEKEIPVTEPTDSLNVENHMESETENSVLSSSLEETGDNLDKTMVLPDIKKEIVSTKKPADEDETLSILTADTIDLSESIRRVQEAEKEQLVPEDTAAKESMVTVPKKAEPKSVQDALVIEPIDAKPVKPLDAELNPVSPQKTEVLEPIPEHDNEAPTLDSLLQSINITNKKKNKKGQQQNDDPFEFLGSVDDF